MLSNLLTMAAVAMLMLQHTIAQTPPNFTPATSEFLNVTYGTTGINPAGITVPANKVTAKAPSLGLPTSLSPNTPYVAIMLDLSIQTGTPAGNTTLLHWILTNLTTTPSASTKVLTTPLSPIAEYFPPGPPPGQTHTYTILLYKEPKSFEVPGALVPYFANLTASVFNRVGFNVSAFAEETGLGAPVAADWWLVGTPAESPSGSSSRSSSENLTPSPTATETKTSFGASATGGSSSTSILTRGSTTSVTPLATQTTSSAGMKKGWDSRWVVLGIFVLILCGF